MSEDQPTTYWDYIRVEELLALQGGLDSDESNLTNEEVLFISVHQIHELWFKLILRELRAARDLFTADPVAEQELSGATRSLARATTILKVAADHFGVMETLTTREYLGFRDKLMPASGFQSAQMRQLEILFGLPEADRISLGAAGGSYRDALQAPGGADSPALRRVEAQLQDLPTLKDAIDDWLFRTPIDGVGPRDADSDGELSRFIEDFLKAHAAEVDSARKRALGMSEPGDQERLSALYERQKDSVRAYLCPTADEGGRRLARIRAAMLFIETYRDLPLLAWPREVLDGLVALEQAFVLFRQRHARMVERVIGRRTGTGGSSGVDYLDETALRYRIFRDLWAVRTMHIRAEATPSLRNEEFYAFRFGT